MSMMVCVGISSVLAKYDSESIAVGSVLDCSLVFDEVEVEEAERKADLMMESSKPGSNEKSSLSIDGTGELPNFSSCLLLIARLVPFSPRPFFWLIAAQCVRYSSRRQTQRRQDSLDTHWTQAGLRVLTLQLIMLLVMQYTVYQPKWVIFTTKAAPAQGSFNPSILPKRRRH